MSETSGYLSPTEDDLEDFFKECMSDSGRPYGDRYPREQQPTDTNSGTKYPDWDSLLDE